MSRGRLIAAALSGALAIAAGIWLGLQAEFAWSAGLVVMGVVVVFALPLSDDARSDAPSGELPLTQTGSDVSRLAWAVNLSEGRVSEIMSRRVRALLRRRLALRGLDPERADHGYAVERVIGAGLWARLGARRVAVTDIRWALEVADVLASTPPGDAPRGAFGKPFEQEER